MSDLLKRWAPGGVALAGAGLVVLGGRSWAADLPVIAALGWAVAAAGLLAWFVGAMLRRLVGAVAAVLLLVAVGTAATSESGAGMVATVVIATLGLVCAVVLLLQAPPRRKVVAAADRVDPWTALDRGDDPTAGPAANEEQT